MPLEPFKVDIRPCGICGKDGPRIYKILHCPGVKGCPKVELPVPEAYAMPRERCPYFFLASHGMDFQEGWTRIIQCGYDVGHDSPHFPGNSQGTVLPQRANAEKEQPAKDSPAERERIIIDRLDRIIELLVRISGQVAK
jgi:hypothetical protein